jgi:uracil-DNA glycosylase
VESLEKHRELVRGCALCFPGGGNAPVVDVAKDVRVVLVGRAPGSTEVTTRLPFTGPAGRRLEGWFSEAGVSREEIYLSALARCFPGKARGGGDKVPSRAMLANCRPHLLRELGLLRPEVVVPVGGWR